MPVASFTPEVARGTDVGRRFTIDGTQPTRIYLGKTLACEIHVNDPLVWRRHAALERAGAEAVGTMVHARSCVSRLGT